MADKIIYSMAVAAEEEPVPVFVGRRDGTVEKYAFIRDVDLNRPSLVLRGHTGAVTGLVASGADEAFSCALDGTIRQWNAEVPEGYATAGATPGNRVVSLSKFSTPLRCLGMFEGRLYAGGEDGTLNVKDGARQSTWPGHYDALCCIAFTASGLIVTGSCDHHLRVWDATQGRCIRLLQGHTNPVVGIATYESEEDDEGGALTGAIVSLARDQTLKVWALPNLQESVAALDALEETVPRPAGGATVSFMEPKKGGADSEMDDEEAEEPADAAPAAPAPAPPAAEEEGETARSVLKSKAPSVVLRDTALGTFELPEVPFSAYRPSDEDGPLPYLYVGTTNGFVYGLDVRRLSGSVLRFVRQNRAAVRRETRELRATLRQSEALLRKQCRHDVRAELRKLTRAAKKTAKEKRAKEREEARKARAEARAAAREAREEDEEDEEYEDGGDDDDDEDEDGGAEEEEEEEEEGADPTAGLSDEQRAQLAAFTATREGERDGKLTSLRAAVQAHLAKLEPLAKATYDRDSLHFHRLRSTTFARVGADTVLALVALNGVVYASQSDRVKPQAIASGVTTL